MFSASVFRHAWTKSVFSYDVPASSDYRVYVNGTEVPVYACRISAYPFNVWWRGHQRPYSQSEGASFVNLVSDEPLSVEVEPLTKQAYERVMLKPYAKGVVWEKRGNRISFSLTRHGGYVLELDDYHNPLYLFNNKPIPCDDPASVTYYFGAGVHFAGKISLKSGESVYLDKDALVYGCIFAENAENLHIYGNGILDDSCEERISEHCYEPYANGNLKFYDCRNLRIEGVGCVNSAVWCVNLFHCFDVSIDGIKVFGQWRYNTDGIDIVNCRNITIRNSFVHSFDDTIAVKGIDRYKTECNRHILVEDCVLWCDWGRAMEIGFETACDEYDDIVFRRCDVLRAGRIACDIQNGDWATVHDVTFEDISVELEYSYTQSQIQRQEDQEYSLQNTLEIPDLLQIINHRFRELYAFLPGMKAETTVPSDPDYAGVHGITVKNVHVYCDERILGRESDCIRIKICNKVPTAAYYDLVVSGVYLNGVRVTEDRMRIEVLGCDRACLTVD